MALEEKAAKKKEEETKKFVETMKIAETADFDRELVDGYNRTYYVYKDNRGNYIESNSLVENSGAKPVHSICGKICACLDLIRKESGEYSGEERKEWVDMSKPRRCSYDKYEVGTRKKIDTVKLGVKYDVETRKMIDRILREGPSLNNTPTRIPGVEDCGITLRQLRAIMANIIRRCRAEKWTDRDGKPLSPDNVTLYDADKYIIRPFTVKSKQSLVTSMPSTAGSQPPRFFVSHWWGESVKDFIACIEQAVRDFTLNNGITDDERGGGMSQDTPVWVCAYGNNQWDLSDITEDPQDSGFAKAMNIAKGRTVTVLDKGGVVFTRVWCIYELNLTLVNPQGGENNQESQEGLWAVYTANRHTYREAYDSFTEVRDAVGIISGGATSDGGASDTTAREKEFPYQLIKKSLDIQIEDAEASEETDRVHILNAIVGHTGDQLNNNPPKTHPMYSELNDSLKGRFASSASSLQGAVKEGETEWKDMLVAMSKSTTKGQMKFVFNKNGGWSDLTMVQAAQLMAHLPLNINTLMIYEAEYGAEFMNAVIQRIKQFSNIRFLNIFYTTVVGEEGGQEVGVCEYGAEFMNAVIQQIKQFRNIELLNICDTTVVGEEGGQEVGVRLAEVLATNTTIIDIIMDDTNLIDDKNKEQWGDALLRNKTVDELSLTGVEYEIVDYLKTRTAARSPRLNIEV